MSDKKEKHLTQFEKLPLELIKIISEYSTFLEFKFSDKNLNAIKYYYRIFRPLMNNNGILYRFYHECLNSNIKVAKWIVKNFNINPRNDYRYLATLEFSDKSTSKCLRKTFVFA